MANDESSSFVSMKIPELKNFLKARDIQISLDGKKRKKAELLELCKNAAEMKVPKVDEEIELKDDLIKSKITLPGGKLLPHPLSLQFWTHNVTNIPDFRFPDISHYGLDSSRDNDILRNNTTLFKLKNMFRQKLLPSSV